ncbi:MAG: diacylglycerol kinase family lipid kinase [Armatimonadota bacterium]|nr:diacylglycerol kinase family lipid kinase [Armatimonadota bacterium]MDR7436521.1 diacylglycerol kinase family lipid kinase [Armatimonadota bacterium]MDR7472556.1 diacylglycerol kinase family lipid kinase [Armatimonadota bacterium]MDR7506058.1 diacylglycerol kinase family lipid kinase [Armatimonadota bacterium]MDR7508507.1 diacylglycerol kinase family lipid kinase [Armatimonadota bacterium]
MINPFAARGRARRTWPRVRTVLQQAGWTLEEVVTGSPQEAEARARAAGGAWDVVVAVGGDGTSHWVINGLLRADSPPPLALIPEGTANDFARSLGIPLSPIAAARALVGAVRRRVDVGEVNGRYYATISGVGFDAEVARRVNRWPRWIRGTAVYVAGILITLATYRPVEVTLVVDGSSRRVRLYLLAAANTNWYGGGMYMAPHARIDDGLLAVVYATDLTPLQTLRVLPSVFSGRHLLHPKVAHTTARTVQVDSATPLAIHADGEVVGTVPASFRVIPQALDVLVPAPSAGDAP